LLKNSIEKKNYIMSILENIKDYFSAKSAGKEIKKAPKGICPNCWGK
jgi:hypothetical protein